MPLFRYFIFVGGSLLALILVANAALPSAPVPEGLTSGTDLPPIRIHSERKLPERVVIDTSVPMPAGAVAPVAVAQAKPQIQPQVQAQLQPAAPAPAEMSAKARVREAFAQLPQEQDAFEPKMTDMATVVVPEPKMYPARQPIKQKAAAARPRYNPHPMMMAQQPRGVFSTW